MITSTRLDSKPALHFSVSGGCSCEFLAKGAPAEEESRTLNPEYLPKLAAAVKALCTEARKFRFLVHWLNGEVPRSEVRVAGKDLIALVEGNQVGNNVIYGTWHGLSITHIS